VTPRLQIWGIAGIPEVKAGDDIGGLIARSEADLADGDVLVVTSKIVSKAQGRLVPGTRADHLATETARVIAKRGDTTIVETHHGFVMAAAGIDASNVPDGHVALLPLEPDRAAADIRDVLKAEIGVDVAVVISDTMGRPWRDGVVDTAIGAAGLDVLWDLRGQRDAAGHLLEATVVAIGDELAAAADLVKGKLSSSPIAVIRGFPFTRNDSERGARPLVRSAADDLFRLGTREAMHQVVATSAPMGDTGVSDKGANFRDGVARAIALVASAEIALTASDDGSIVIARGDPLAVGHTFGRLAAALAAEGLRCTAPVATTDGATITVCSSNVMAAGRSGSRGPG
jgi:coenzyme F420-0:L-glutamate ligase/coenzyme F420-1:gamma-L-glutamate ligase